MRIVKLLPTLRNGFRRIRSSALLAVFVGAAGIALPSAAASISFSVDMAGDSRVGTVEETSIEGTPYVSVVSLAEQFGGAVSLLTTRVRVDAAGSTAWIQADDTRVNAFRIFTLSQPAKRVESDFLIATVDVPTFFEKAFRLTVVRSASAETMGMTPAPAAPEAPIDSPTDELQPSSPAPAPMSAIGVIGIDPGHGGLEMGIEGPGGVTEKAIALDIAIKLKTFLESKVSQQIVLTRDEDLALNEPQRAAILQNSSADLLIALHAGSSVSPQVRGSMVLYETSGVRVQGRLTSSREEARRLAGLIVESLKTVSAVPVRGLDYAEMRALAHPQIPGVMIEVGCLTNSADAAALGDDAVRASIANAIGEGMLQFLGARGSAP